MYPYSLLNDISSTHHPNVMKVASMDRTQNVLPGGMISLLCHFNSTQRIEGTFHSLLIRKRLKQTQEKGCHMKHLIYHSYFCYVSFFCHFQLENSIQYVLR